MHSIEAKFVIGPSDILFAGVYLCTFQPEYFTAWDSEGVKAGYNSSPSIDTASFSCCAVFKALHCLLLYFAAVVRDAIIAGPPDTHEKGWASVFLIMAASL